MHQLLFSLLLVLLPTQLGYHWWPSWALVLGRRLDYLSPTLYLTDIIIFLLLISWYVAKRKKIHFPILQTILIIGFIVTNIYFAVNRMVALIAWTKILELVALGIYIVKTKPKFSSVVIPVSLGVFYSSLIAIVQFLLQHSIGGIFWLLGERTFSAGTPGIAQIPLCFPNRLNCPLMLRSYATFPHPNVLGGFLAVTLPLIIYQLTNLPINQLTKTKKIFYILTLSFGIIALVLTFSRSAWVVAVLSSMYVVFKKKRHVFFPFLLSAILIIFFIGNTFGFQDESVVVRQQLNAAAISMFRASPIIGSGTGNFLVRLPDYLVSRTIYFLQPAHNIYLLALAETGIIGFAIFLWILWKAVNNNKIIIPILLLGFVDHYFLTLQQGQLLLAIFLSLSLIQ